MYLKLWHVLENFRHLNLIASKLRYKIKRVHSFHSFPPTLTSQGICGRREESSQCRLKCRRWKWHLNHTSLGRIWPVIKSLSADDRYDDFLSSVLQILGFHYLRHMISLVGWRPHKLHYCWLPVHTQDLAANTWFFLLLLFLILKSPI